eukprot:CAMPEP_0182528686 /NCGR_PEP_ID=MMETSP1323-20130603/4673_1 /TAXON_ID=236787 /ORGANISM="Florenciella parvula, Strain RCC1693" /LENGTH=166 /DNA_ID=CAMNT_0024737829 /DNA_START=305 /DNA_END=805 /DNA_ORIENTATION=+
MIKLDVCHITALARWVLPLNPLQQWDVSQHRAACSVALARVGVRRIERVRRPSLVRERRDLSIVIELNNLTLHAPGQALRSEYPVEHRVDHPEQDVKRAGGLELLALLHRGAAQLRNEVLTQVFRQDCLHKNLRRVGRVHARLNVKPRITVPVVATHAGAGAGALV